MSEINYITKERFDLLGGGKFEPGDILFCLRGSLGKFGVVDSEVGRGAIASSLVIVRPKPSSSRLSREYLCSYLASEICARMIDKWAGGAAQPNLGVQDLARFLIPMPPTLAEQRAIAAALGDVDALLASLDKLIAKKRDLKQAAMQQLLTGQQRLPGFQSKWETVILGDLLLQKATYGIVTAGKFSRSGVPMVRGGDIKDGRIEGELPFVSREKSLEYSRTVLRRDDVLIALVGYPGEAARVPPDLEGANISRAVGLLRLTNKIAPDYLVSYLNSPMGRRMVLAPSAGSAQLVVNLAAVNRLRFVLPAIGEQHALAGAFSDINAELTALEARREKTQLLKQGMMQELLTGRTRLV